MNPKKVFFITLAIFSASAGFAQTDINQKLERLDLKTAGLDAIIELFGEPEKYIWGQNEYQKEQLPEVYLAVYPNGLRFVMNGGAISEIRHEGPTGYRFKDTLQIGSSLETAMEVLGQPTQTVSFFLMKGRVPSLAWLQRVGRIHPPTHPIQPPPPTSGLPSKSY